MSLALLVATFMWGCQEQASSPVGPEGLGPQFDKAGTPGDPCPGGGVRDGKGHCHGGDELNPEGPDVDVTLTVGIMSVGPQRATLGTDGGTLNVFIDDRRFKADLNLTTPVTFPPCRSENTDTGLGLADFLTKTLVDDEQPGFNFNFQVDRNKEISRKHGLKVVWDDGENILLVQLRSDKEFGAFTVVEEDGVGAGLESDQTRFTFKGGAVTGGSVFVRRTNASPQANDKLTCPYDGLDVVILLDRSPSP